MSNYKYAAELVKQRVTMCDAIGLYAPDPAPKHNRIPCPIHLGKDPNLWFSERGYHCFVCGAGGDVINFVQHVFKISFIAALDKLNSDFGCGAVLDRKPTLREQRSAQKRYKQIMSEREEEEAKRKAQEDLYNSLWDEWCRLDRNLMDYAPRTPDEQLHPLFAEALQKIEHQSYLIETML